MFKELLILINHEILIQVSEKIVKVSEKGRQ